MLVRGLMTEFYSIRYFFVDVYDYFSLHCHIAVNGCVTIRIIHQNYSEFICVYDEWLCVMAPCGESVDLCHRGKNRFLLASRL